jgi:hypothetical protein
VTPACAVPLLKQDSYVNQNSSKSVSLASAGFVLFVLVPHLRDTQAEIGLESTTPPKSVQSTGSKVTCAPKINMGRRKIEIKAIKDDRNRSV